MQPNDPAVPVPGACSFAASRLLPLLDAFLSELGPARSADDPEAVHRLRVASRRLRAALPLFSSCFPEKDLHQGIRGIKECTRALGAARDTDVRIAFLKKYLKAGRPDPAERDDEKTADGKNDANPLVHLQKKLRNERKEQQENLIAVLDGIEEGGKLQVLKGTCQALAMQKIRGKKNCISGILPVAADRIGARLIQPQQYDTIVHSPDAVPEHHALRIALKKLRYTLETFAPLYRRGMAKQIAQLKRLQDLLGEIHDCDIWINEMGQAVLDARSRKALRAISLQKKILDLAPLRQLQYNREKERNRLYRQFVRRWDALARTGFWEDLEACALEGQRSACRRQRKPEKNGEEPAFLRMLEEVPDQQAHSIQVAGLADKLFYGLSALHNLPDRDRALLRYAALVHDIGWAEGGAGHQRRGAGRILAAGDLPVTVKEQGMIALIVGLHGGGVTIRHKGFYRLLPQADKQCVLALAALLRIADGLDYTRDNCVTDLRCTIRETEILCELTGTGDTGPCRERAIKKGDLFAEVFALPLVIS
ncbi:CHAD domain-containing protein [Methanoregula sp. UBA64]|uniref:CHAD domain-containing protein n=1 Tax=Methanoregula sp. UBA64 TaxID=1915554 RepID=UPI0025D73D1E|nr:CHAD domain-containing protein [Methanoregula sp. UBA64]